MSVVHAIRFRQGLRVPIFADDGSAACPQPFMVSDQWTMPQTVMIVRLPSNDQTTTLRTAKSPYHVGLGARSRIDVTSSITPSSGIDTTGPFNGADGWLLARRSRPSKAICKTVGSAYVGSNPTPANTSENGPPSAETRPGGPFPS